jgi:hypothetical protein
MDAIAAAPNGTIVPLSNGNVWLKEGAHKFIAGITYVGEDPKRAAAQLALRPRLTTEFLETLREAVEVVGWSHDMVETVALYEGLCQDAGVAAGNIDTNRWMDD